MDGNWEYCLAAIRLEEGGNDDDPQDHGGRTSRGITQKEYDAYCTHKGFPRHDVWTATDGEIDEIYRVSYWQPWCPIMPSGVDLEFFDEAVNGGMHESALLLQRALGVKADGHIGIITRTALASANPPLLVLAFAEQRLKFYRSLRQFRRYGRGWTARTLTIKTKALKLTERT